MFFNTPACLINCKLNLDDLFLVKQLMKYNNKGIIKAINMI